MNWSTYEAHRRIPLGVAVTITFAGPLAVAVIGSRRPLDGVWIALAAAGIVLLVGPGGGPVDAVGIGFALAAAACWAAYIYLSKRTGAAFAGGSGLAIAMVVGALIVLPAGVIQAGDALAEPDLLASAFVVALASSVVPYSLELEALRRLPEARSRRPDVARPGGRRAGRLRRARPGPRRRGICSRSRWWSWPAPGRPPSVTDDDPAPARGRCGTRAATIAG